MSFPVTCMVSVTPPSGGVGKYLNTTSATSALKNPQTPTVVDTLTYQWSRPTGRDHQEPGTISLTLIGLDPSVVLPLIPWGWQLGVAMWSGPKWGSGTLSPWISGYIDQVSYEPWSTSRGLWRYTLTVADVVAHWQQVRVGAPPWPQETARVRVGRVLNASRETLPGVDQDITPDDAYCPARDVDSVSGLELLQGLTDPRTSLVDEGGRLVAASGPGADLTETANGIGLVNMPRATAPTVPARAIATRLRRVDRSGILTHAAVSGVVPVTNEDPKELTLSVSAPAAADDGPEQSASWKRDTDMLLTMTPDLADALATTRTHAQEGWVQSYLTWAQRILTASGDPAVVLEDCEVLLDQMSRNDALTLVGSYARTNGLVSISQCPPDLDSLQQVIAQTITVRAGEMRLTGVRFAPASLAGGTPVLWRELRQNAAPKLSQVAGSLHFNDFAAVRSVTLG